MASFLSPKTFEAYQAVLDCPVGPFAQELLALAVFGVCYFLTRRRRLLARTSRNPKSGTAPGSFQRASSGDGIAPRDGGRAAAGPGGDGAAAAGMLKVSEQKMLKLLESHQFTKALNVHRAIERSGRGFNFSEPLYCEFVQSGIRIGKLDVVEYLLHSMIKRQRSVPSLAFWRTVFKMICSRKHFSFCVAVHETYCEQIPFDVVIDSCVLNACLEAGDRRERAAALLARCSPEGLGADERRAFFRFYAALGDAEGAEAWYHKCGAEAGGSMLSWLLHLCVGAGDLERGFRVLREAQLRDLALPSPEEKRVGAGSYTMLIKGFAQAGNPLRCADCLRDMLRNRIILDDAKVGILLDACTEETSAEVFEEIAKLLMERDLPTDTATCTSFFKGLVRAKFLSEALRICEEMTRCKSPHIDIAVYSMIIKALVDQHDLDRALGLVKGMEEAGHKPDDIILTHLLKGCWHASNLRLGKALFADMVSSGVTPSEFTLATLLKLYGRCGEQAQALELLAGWEVQYGVKPTVIHYTCLTNSCMRSNSCDMAWQVYELMGKNGVKADSHALKALLLGMAQARQWDRVAELAGAAIADGAGVPAEILSSALLVMQAAGGQDSLVEQLKAQMQARGMEVKACLAEELKEQMHALGILSYGRSACHDRGMTRATPARAGEQH